MAFDEALAARIRQILARRKTVEEQKMFGCIAFLISGKAAVGVWKDSLIARVGPDGYDDALLEPHVGEFDITGRPMRGWVVVGPGGVGDDEPLNAWIERAVTFVTALPKKSGRGGSMPRATRRKRRE